MGLSALVAFYEFLNATAAAARYPLLVGAIAAAAQAPASSARALSPGAPAPLLDSPGPSTTAGPLEWSSPPLTSSAEDALQAWLLSTLFAAVAHGMVATAGLLLLQRVPEAEATLQRLQLERRYGDAEARAFSWQGPGHILGDGSGRRSSSSSSSSGGGGSNSRSGSSAQFVL